MRIIADFLKTIPVVKKQVEKAKIIEIEYLDEVGLVIYLKNKTITIVEEDIIKSITPDLFEILAEERDR